MAIFVNTSTSGLCHSDVTLHDRAVFMLSLTETNTLKKKKKAHNVHTLMNRIHNEDYIKTTVCRE